MTLVYKEVVVQKQIVLFDASNTQWLGQSVSVRWDGGDMAGGKHTALSVHSPNTAVDEGSSQPIPVCNVHPDTPSGDQSFLQPAQVVCWSAAQCCLAPQNFTLCHQVRCKASSNSSKET